jgi:hypothetical protein
LAGAGHKNAEPIVNKILATKCNREEKEMPPRFSRMASITNRTEPIKNNQLVRDSRSRLKFTRTSFSGNGLSGIWVTDGWLMDTG